MSPIPSYENDLRATRTYGILAEYLTVEIGVAPRFAADLKENLILESSMGPEVNEVCFDTQHDLNDRDLELRLNALTHMVNKLSPRKEVKQSHPFKKLIIKPKKPSIVEQELSSKNTEPRSPSALKSPNSPTSGRKKSVCFADSIGLDLEHVKLFKSDVNDNYMINDDIFDSEAVQLSLTSRVKVLDVTPCWAAASYSSVNFNDRYLAIHFAPRNMAEVFEIIEAQNVCLESMNTTRMFVSGLIKVKNIGFEKKVNLRYTLDGWRTYAEIPCNFSFSNTHDVFCFSLCLPLDLPAGGCCEICIRYAVAGQNFWDNNNGENYKLDCSTSPSKKACSEDFDIDILTIAQLPVFM